MTDKLSAARVALDAGKGLAVARTKTSCECNYIQRLRNLMEKGQTLMRVNQHIQAAVVNPSSTPTNPSPVMSQIGQAIANSPIGALKSRSISFKRDFIDTNDSSRLFSSPSPTVLGAGLGVGMLSPDVLRLTPESNVYRWVISTIKKSEEQVVQSGQLFERLLAEDPASVAEEFRQKIWVSIKFCYKTTEIIKNSTMALLQLKCLRPLAKVIGRAISK